ncbi:MBL fold metallo-hydrolase [Siccirubricoccus sp. KC 17139]|uniref:MBL fold metallo-hydrolase n=1 Tax=Siccirubricoccus soli TaxID=2899147 RepID=A0ABT1D3C1_9PROT|nr:MBL fold metallo-hydrolase [Siccirubricoccus soli]MCO6416416.1 MBL fold metallo-hydrolase [Siccirubricoccus soli]MCP2682550.1 MBL fold metallo-hydrolase [Siccirubricoccus soli]
MATSFQLGDLTIHRIIEEERPLFDPLEFFPTLTKEVLEENRSWLEPTSIDPATGKLILCIQSYIVETPHHRILVDTCVGNHKERPTRPFWHQKNDATWERNLAGAGFRPEDIDYVMCTHLHVDHVGWNTQLKDGRWVPTFPKARYIFGEREYAYWEAEHRKTPNPVIADSVLPVVEAGQVDLVATDHAMNDHVRLTPTPGHTPDHYAVELGKGETIAVLTGDLIHSPLQARYPELGMRADVDSAQGAVTRRKFLECHCDSGRLMCTGHFASPSTGHFTRWGDGFRFMPASP